MEDNNVINQETELVENNEALTVDLLTEEDLESNGSGLYGLGFVALGAIVAGTAAIIHSNRDKINAKRTERQIKKLQKKGYNVSKLEIVSPEKDVDSEEDYDE